MSELHSVTVREVRALRAHNIHAYFPVLCAIMDIGPYDAQRSSDFLGFVERLTAWLPGLRQHECSVGRPGGFVERLHRGTYLAHITEHVCLALQNLMGFDVGFGRARRTGEPGVYRVVVAYEEEAPARAALATALRLTLAAMHDEPFDAEAEIEALLALADEHRLGPSTAAIVRAASRRSIPVIRLTPTGSLIQLGYGKHQKRIIASETTNTSAIAVELCHEKPLTNGILRSVGVPVPDGRTVRSADEAWAAAQDIGLPVVVKPENGNQGRGVTVGLCDEAQIRSAFAIAFAVGTVLVERHVMGADHRLLVVNGEMVAAARREPAAVVGDGLQSVEQLVAHVNRDPRRRPGHGNVLTQIQLDGAADLVLAQQRLARTSIPEAGRVVRLRTNGNLSTGGTATDVTDHVHPHNARLAELAAQILGLDVAGIDMLCSDVRRPLAEQGGAIVEVNAAPGLRMHLHPTQGKPRDVAEPIVRMLYPEGQPTRIPILAVTGTNGKTTTVRLVAHIFETAHARVGMTTTDGVYIGKERVMEGDCAGPRSAQAVLLHPHVDVAVLEAARGGIIREGLGYDSATIGVVTNVSADHLGSNGVETIDDLAHVKQVVVEAVARDGAAVLNADDPLVAEMAASTDSEIIYFSRQPSSQVVAAHVAAGGRCVLADGDTIVLQHGPSRIDLIELSRVAFAGGGTIAFQVANALAATAAAWGAGVNPAFIARALSTFRSDAAMAPGRFNRVEIDGIEFVLDYAHNEAAMRALGEAVRSLEARRTHVVMGLPGDRRDQDLERTVEASQTFADSYVFHDQHDRRGREPGEVPRLLATRVSPGTPVQIAPTQLEALRRVWGQLQSGDRVVVVVDEVEETLAAVQALSDEEGCSFPVGGEHAYAPADHHVVADRAW